MLFTVCSLTWCYMVTYSCQRCHIHLCDIIMMMVHVWHVLIKKYFHGVHVVFMISWSLHQCDIASSLHLITFIIYLKWFKTCIYYVMHNICLPQYKKLKLFISVMFSGADFSFDILDCLVDFHFGDYCFLD